MHLLLQGFAVVRWTVENTWLRWNQKYLIRSVCRELMRTASPVDMVFILSVGSWLAVKKDEKLVERRRRQVKGAHVAREQDGRAARLRL